MAAALRVSHPLLSHTSHRPWPVPSRRWIMVQQWRDLLFMHWPVAPDVLRPHVPSGLPLDLFDGDAWLTVAPFEVSRVAPFDLFSMPGAGRFPELNVRTYVRLHDKGGVYFFSLDAASWLAVVGARVSYKLPYLHARMSITPRGDAIEYDCVRTDRRKPPAEFKGTYAPTGPVQLASVDSVDHWLTERYCLYAHAAGRILRADIHHEPWPLQPARADVHTNTMAQSHGLPAPAARQVLHFARRLDVLVWAPKEVPR